MNKVSMSNCKDKLPSDDGNSKFPIWQNMT